MEKVNLTKTFLFLVIISKHNMINCLKHIMEANVLWYWSRCDNNIKRKSISEGMTTLHNFNKGYWQSNSSLFSLVTQQIIKWSTCIERGKPLFYPLHNLMFLSNLHEKYHKKPNVHFMVNYIIKDNEKIIIM